MKKILYVLLLFPLVVMAQSTDQNWVKSKTYKVPTQTLIATPTPTEAVVQVSYFDGLGRPIQQVAHAQSGTGKDIVTHIEYDVYGRMEKEFLPYANQSASLNFNSTASNDVLTFYNTANYENTLNPFSQKEFEASPLNRVFKQAAPGDAWKMNSGHEIEFDYQTNDSTEVKFYKAYAIWNVTTKLYEITLLNESGSVFYTKSELFKTINKNENHTGGNNTTTQEFKNKEGKVVLKRTFNNNDAHDTYYVYDQFGNLTFVIPPVVDTAISITQSVLNSMCYQYKYDYRNRLVEKKLPGKQWEYIVYDKLDRVVATGPAYNPYGATNENDKGWLLTKYDVLNRPVYTAWYSASEVSSVDRKVLQDSYNSATIYSENKTTSANIIDGITTKYTNQVSPTTFILLTINYYDTYDYPNAPIVPPTLPDSTLPIATNVKGLPTGSWVRVLDVAGSLANELSYTIYDEKFRPVSSYTKNYLGGYTQVDSKLDWAGKTEYTLTKHKRLNGNVELITRDLFDYSQQDRLVKHRHKINSLPEQLLTFNTYDELGQLLSKKVGGTDITGMTSFQKVDFSYNIRGWLRGINNVANLSPTATDNDLFAFKINYDLLEDGSQSTLYNGNISQTLWRTNSDNVKRQYSYQFDQLNRLLEANYSKPGSASTLDNYLEKLSYDKNGNIQFLERNGNMDSNGLNTVNQIDKLDYIYDTNNKNLLLKVIDKSLSPQGFNETNDVANGDSDGITDNTNDYSYDLNGNMISDTNKGIGSIIYNHLNLPIKITFVTTGTIEYIYNSVGQKVLKKVTENGVVTTTDYLSGYQYKNTVLQFFPHAEGYVKFTDGGKIVSGIYSYIFNYTDHLGNIRLSYTKDFSTGTLKIIEENHYYAFGLKHTNYNSDLLAIIRDGDGGSTKIAPPLPQLPPAYKYKYNGKELQEELGLNMYDYGARNYDPALGRWMNIDPLAEISRRWSPYTYAYNCPTYFIDPDGMLSESFINDMWNKSGNNTTWTNNDDGTFGASNGESADTGEKEKEKTTKSTTGETGGRIKRKGTGENINYFDPNDKDHIGLYLTAEKQLVENGILKIFTHGNDHNILGYQTAEDLADALYKDSEVWRNFVDNGGKLTVIFYACSTANKFEDGSNTPIAQEFANINFEKGRNLEVIAPSRNITNDYDRKRFIVNDGGGWIKYMRKVVNNLTTKKQ